ncbi:hypothetical protein DFS33DRAFT_1369938 [Desarmillaria ectypa]|nr:hypothetical protein DFS33DRAFT_1369938 [Desarmillaria ectypa]
MDIRAICGASVIASLIINEFTYLMTYCQLAASSFLFSTTCFGPYHLLTLCSTYPIFSLRY